MDFETRVLEFMGMHKRDLAEHAARLEGLSDAAPVESTEAPQATEAPDVA